MGEEGDGEAFDALHPGPHVAVAFAEVEDGVDDELSGAVQSGFAAAFNDVHRQRGIKDVRGLAAAPQSRDERVFHEENRVVAAARDAIVAQLALKGKAFAVLHAAQIPHLHKVATPCPAFRFGTATSSGAPGVRGPMRAWPWLVLVVTLAAPLGAAQDAFLLPAGSYRSLPLDAQDGSRYDITFQSDVAIDVILVAQTDEQYGNDTHVAAVLNQTQGQLQGVFPSAGRWVLVIDNSEAIAGGASGASNASITMTLMLVHVLPGGVPEPVSEGTSNPWPVLMLTAPYWDIAVVGLGGMALWFLLLAALVAVRYTAGWDKIGVLAVGSGLLILLWSLLPRTGPVANVFLPLMIAAGVAWLATRGTRDGLQAARMAFISGGLGALLGVTLAHLLRMLWSSPGDLMLGTGRFDDPVFLLPVAAGGGALLLAVVKAIVEASEDDEEPEAAPADGGLTTSFTVTCLRCATPMTVDRSMRRYRVATDRYEFACPNCHAWMEWAEPKPT